MDLQCDAVHMLWKCLKFSGISTMLPLVNVTVGLHRPPSSNWWKPMKSYDYKPRTLNWALDLHTVGIYAWQFIHVVRTFNLTLRLGNAVIIFNQIAINMTDRHTKSIQILLHVTTSYASKQSKNSQPSLTFLLSHRSWDLWQIPQMLRSSSWSTSWKSSGLSVFHLGSKLLTFSQGLQRIRFLLMILQELKNDVPIIIWYHVIAFKIC